MKVEIDYLKLVGVVRVGAEMCAAIAFDPTLKGLEEQKEFDENVKLLMQVDARLRECVEVSTRAIIITLTGIDPISPEGIPTAIDQRVRVERGD